MLEGIDQTKALLERIRDHLQDQLTPPIPSPLGNNHFQFIKEDDLSKGVVQKLLDDLDLAIKNCAAALGGS